MTRVLSPADVRGRLRTAAAAAVGGDVTGLEFAESWLTDVSARELVRVDAFARQFRYEGPTLGKPEQWTSRVLSESVPAAAALASMHPDGFLRERAVGVLVGDRSPLSDRMLALRVADHVAQVREPAIAAMLGRTEMLAASRIMPVLQRFEARSRGAEARTLYLGAIESRHGEPQVWVQLRESADRDLRRAAFRHSLVRGLLHAQDAVIQLPRERDQVVRRLLANVIANNAEPDVVRAVLLHARSAESRVLGLVRLDASQLDPSYVEVLLVDSSVLVRSWARQRWTEMGNDPVATYRQLAGSEAKPARQARAYLGLAEAGAHLNRGEVLDLVHSPEIALQKVGLRLLVDKATNEDVSDLLGLVAGEYSRVARLASDVLAQNVGLWSIDDLELLKRATDPALRRRGWWLHRSRRGWETLIADLEIARDPDQHLAVLGRQPTAPMYLPPDERQRHHIAEHLKDAPINRDQKLVIALAAGLRDLMTELRQAPRHHLGVPAAARTERVTPWWRRIRKRNDRA